MKVYRFKAYTNANGSHLHRMISRFGIVRNYAVKMGEVYYRLTGKTLGKYTLSKHIAKAKKNPNRRTAKMVAGLDAQAVQEELNRVDKGMRSFFAYCKRKKNGVKASKRVRPPKVRKAKFNKSFTLKQCGYKFMPDTNQVRIGQTYYGYFKSQELKGKVKRLTIKRDCVGDIWFVVLTDWIESENLPRTGRSAGFDFGLKTFLTASDGTKIESPQFLKSEMNRYRRLSRKLSKKVKGSHNRHKARLALAHFYRRITNRREDWQWKTARMLVENYDLLCFENLEMTGMQRLWGRKVGDYGFAGFLAKVEYLAAKCGKDVVKVGRFFASSQVCSKCGYQNKSVKDLSIREWECPQCGAHHDRDLNAEMNILREGASSLGRGLVRPQAKRNVA